LLPDDRFVAAILMRLDPWRQELEIWNGGMPALQCLDNNGRLLNAGKSTNMSLGVLSNAQISVKPQLIYLQDIAYLMMYSDGLTETILPSGETLSHQNLPGLLQLGQVHPLQNLCQIFDGVAAEDDISLCLIDCALLVTAQQCELRSAYDRVGSFNVDFQLHGASMVQIDIAGKIVDLLRAQNLPLEFLQRVFTVLSELFANALEHGVLEMQSTLKDQPDGFISFYEEKERRIAMLHEQQFVEIHLGWSAIKNTLTVGIKDSGAGFVQKTNQTPTEVQVYGRGLSLIQKLSSQLEIVAPGNEYRVVMSP
jgi:two-component system, HptB-dependent secretion and biofilm response regulator